MRYCVFSESAHTYQTRHIDIDFCALNNGHMLESLSPVDPPRVLCGECGLVVKDDDEAAFGCDDVACGNWYHGACLSPIHHSNAVLSIDDNIDWLCPRCVQRIDRVCSVCLVEEVVINGTAESVQSRSSGWLQCGNDDCLLWYHIHCLSMNDTRYAIEMGINWWCDQCLLPEE